MLNHLRFISKNLSSIKNAGLQEKRKKKTVLNVAADAKT
jgi:hypothetical protein